MHFSKAEKAQWLEDWKKSGKNAWAYARENGLCPQTFLKWTKLKTESKSCFVEVPTKAAQPFQDLHEILIEKGELKIHIPLAPGSGELRTIFGALGCTV